MKKWLNDILTKTEKKPMPILSFPSARLMNVGINQLVTDSQLQAKGMHLIAERYSALGAVSMMDLSVEAEAFGAQVRFDDNEVPSVIGAVVTEPHKADELVVPSANSARCPVYIKAAETAKKLITDRPVFAGVIGPFSLAGRLMGVEDAMMNCYTDPEAVHTTLNKASEFLIQYILEYKKVGADGIVMAEPLAGMLSPAMADEFSSVYVKGIIDAVQDDNFIVIYHNCGNNTCYMLDSILSVGASAYHFGNAISMKDMLEKIPADTVVMGNIDPAGVIMGGTPEMVRAKTLELLEECSKYPNFVISSGCDIPPVSPFENIDAFFNAVDEFYSRGK